MNQPRDLSRRESMMLGLLAIAIFIGCFALFGRSGPSPGQQAQEDRRTIKTTQQYYERDHARNLDGDPFLMEQRKHELLIKHQKRIEAEEAKVLDRIVLEDPPDDPITPETTDEKTSRIKARDEAQTAKP